MVKDKASIYICLVHHPVYNKNMEIVTTSITNLDLHDISRSAITYGINKYYVIHPAPSHRRVIESVISYWLEGYGGVYNPDRKTAFSIIDLKHNLEEVIAEIEEINGCKPLVITTDARVFSNSISYEKLREMFSTHNKVPCLILFGTGWGLEKSLMESADYILEPIVGAGEYNHLSVRAAVAIILDRLLSR